MQSRQRRSRSRWRTPTSACCASLISRHAELTGSPRAKWILDNWARMAPLFVKVFPQEYKRVLAKPKPAEAVPEAVTPPPQAPAVEEVLRG